MNNVYWLAQQKSLIVKQGGLLYDIFFPLENTGDYLDELYQ
jgi:hypothetical protein